MEITFYNWQFQGLNVMLQSFNLSVVAGFRNIMMSITDRLFTNPIIMTVKFFLQDNITNGNGQILVYGDFQDIDTNTLLESFYVTLYANDFDDLTSFKTAAYAGIVAEAVNQGYTGFSNSDIQDLTDYGISPARSFNNAPGRSIVTGTGATGFQISSSRDALVSYTPTLVTTATIAGNSSDVIALEICSTNSATAGNWTEIARVTNGQALSLALTLQSVQTTSGVLSGMVPAGYYAKIRAITSGTVSNSMSSGQEILM